MEIYDVGGGPADIQTAELNGDGLADFLIANHYSGSVSVVHGDENGTLSVVQEIDVFASAFRLDIGDIDGDGDLDAVFLRTPLGQTPNTFVTLFNMGNGLFEYGAAYGGDSDSWDIALGDLDEDGDQDVALTHRDGNEILIYPNSGNGVFTNPVSVMSGNKPIGLAIEDLDDDGDQDMAVTNFEPYQIAILENSGGSNFSIVATHEIGPSPRQIIVTDVENDGDPDLVVVSQFANNFPNDIAVLRNDGNGSFADPELYDVGGFSEPASATAGDLNLDGFVDLAVANDNNENVKVLFNSGEGLFGEPVEYPVNGAGATKGPIRMAMANVSGNSAPRIGRHNRRRLFACHEEYW